MKDNASGQKELPNILAVDDMPTNLELLIAVLEKSNYKIRTVTSGALALDAARNEPPDLILLDINMPEMNGYQVCRLLKEDEKLKDIPVIFLSAYNETINKEKAFRLGAVDYITKPFQFEEVRARIETHLELRSQKRQLQEHYNILNELEKKRDDLIFMIVHDLRAPVTVIYELLQKLEKNEKKNLSEDNIRDIAEAMKAATQTIQLVSSVLDSNGTPPTGAGGSLK